MAKGILFVLYVYLIYLQNGYYSWSSNPYSQWTYTRWAPDLEPSGAGQCVALKRKFEGNDTNAIWYSSSDCGVLSEFAYKPYICKKNCKETLQTHLLYI